MKWPKGNDLIEVMDGFKDFCGMPLVHGAMDATQIHVQKSKAKVFTIDFYSFKSKGQSFKCKLLWTTKRRFEMCMLGFQVLSMMFEFWGCFPSTIEPLNIICLLLNLDKRYQTLHSKGQGLSLTVMANGVA